MLQKLLTGIVISAVSFIAGRKIEKVLQKSNQSKETLEDFINADKVKKAANALSDDDLDKLRKEFTE